MKINEKFRPREKIKKMKLILDEIEKTINRKTKYNDRFNQY